MVVATICLTLVAAACGDGSAPDTTTLAAGADPIATDRLAEDVPTAGDDVSPTPAPDDTDDGTDSADANADAPYAGDDSGPRAWLPGLTHVQATVDGRSFDAVACHVGAGAEVTLDREWSYLIDVETAAMGYQRHATGELVSAATTSTPIPGSDAIRYVGVFDDGQTVEVTLPAQLARC